MHGLEGHSSSSKMTQFDRQDITNYQWSITVYVAACDFEKSFTFDMTVTCHLSQAVSSLYIKMS